MHCFEYRRERNALGLEKIAQKDYLWLQPEDPCVLEAIRVFLRPRRVFLS